jgi:hypothetical protein
LRSEVEKNQNPGNRLRNRPLDFSDPVLAGDHLPVSTKSMTRPASELPLEDPAKRERI